MTTVSRTTGSSGGRIDDSFFEGCYVFLSERPGSQQVDVRLEHDRPGDDHQQSRVAQADAVDLHRPRAGHGPPGGSGPNTAGNLGTYVEASGLTIRIDQAPSHGNLTFPPRFRCAGPVTVVWTGSGGYPASVPACVTVTTDRGAWDRAVGDWTARHR